MLTDVESQRMLPHNDVVVGRVVEWCPPGARARYWTPVLILAVMLEDDADGVWYVARGDHDHQIVSCAYEVFREACQSSDARVWLSADEERMLRRQAEARANRVLNESVQR